LLVFLVYQVYIFSLAGSKLDGSILVELFGNLPKNCIELLEDVDSAGINRGKGKHVIMTKVSLIDDTSHYEREITE
jgi:hypothetical protein